MHGCFFKDGEYKNVNIWGTMCDCGNEVSTLTNEHPWMDVDVFYDVKCEKCGKVHRITKDMAATFYENKIYDLFKDVKGNVLELGSGGGFITKYLSTKSDVDNILAIDIDDESNEYATEYIHGDINKFKELGVTKRFDYVVCRDVFMYLDNLDELFYEISKKSSKLLFLNWYNPNHKNCHNKTNPIEIFEMLSKYYKDIEIVYPPFYKWGYLIRSR